LVPANGRQRDNARWTVLGVPKPAPWRQAFEAELLTFPAGRHDDQVDALGLVGQLLDRMVRGTPAKREKTERRDVYAQWFDTEDERVSWKTA
jgi:hypothetical protein